MDAQTIIAALAFASGGAGGVLVWLVRIEHRLTRLETKIDERMPRQA